MKVTAEKLEGSRVSLEVEAPETVVNQAVEKAFKSLVKRYNVPGFRRGKAPRSIFERYYGRDYIYEEAMKQVLPEQYLAAVKEAGIEPVDDPSFEEINFKEGEPLRFKAVVYVKPEVTLADTSDMSLSFESPSVTEEDIDKQIEILKERMAELQPLSDDVPVEKGDYVTCHITGLEGGVNLDQDFGYIEVGREYGFVPGLGEALVGMKKGEVKEFTSTLPAKEGEEPRTARFKVEVKTCYRKRVPQDMEELAKNLGKSSAEEVRNSVKDSLMSIRLRAAKEQHMSKIEDMLLEKATVEIPEVMIERRTQELLERFERRLQESRTSLDEYLKMSNTTMEALHEQMKKTAERDVKLQLTLDAIAEKENIKAPQEKVESVLKGFAAEAGQDLETIRTTFEVRGLLPGLQAELDRAQVVEEYSKRAAEKAGTPIPPVQES